MVRDEIKKIIEKALKSAYKKRGLSEKKIPEVLVEQPRYEAHGDYSTNVSASVAKDFKISPLEVSKEIKSNIDISKFSGNIEVYPPIFTNFFVSEDVLLKELEKILKEKDKYGSSKKGKGKTIVVDYSGVNIAKPFGIGHLRSTVIGQAIYNLYKYLGYKVIGDNHIGDWGTQFGKLIYAIKEWGDEEKIKKGSIKVLLDLYVRFHEEAEKNPEIEDEGREWFKKLEQGDKEAKRLWKMVIKITLAEFERIYKLLGIEIDLMLGESFYEPMLKDIVKEALDKKIALKSEGAIIIPFPNDSLPPLMIKKSDGTTLYSTRDLATIKYREKKFKPYKIIYEVGADQTLHFRQLFWAAELLGWGNRDDYVHVRHGLMRLKTGRMRTRKGEIVFLEDVLKQAIEKSKKKIEEKNPNLKDKNKIAKIIGIGAIKYNDLSSHPSTDIIFNWDKILNLEGNSGPYLQYAYIRAKSIIEKSGEKIKFKKGKLKEEKEIQLLRKLQKFPDVVEKAAENYSPNLICNYLFELSKIFNSFYELVPVLKAEDDLKKMRLALIEATAQVIKNGLNLLGISAPSKM